MSITKLFLNYFNCVQEKSFFTVEFDFMSHLKVRLNKKMDEKILPSAVLNHQGFLFLSDRVLFRVKEKKEKDKQEHSMGKLSQQKLCFTVYLVVLICIICTAGDMTKQQFYGPCFANGCFIQTKVTIFTVLQFKFTSEYYTLKKKKIKHTIFLRLSNPKPRKWVEISKNIRAVILLSRVARLQSCLG